MDDIIFQQLNHARVMLDKKRTEFLNNLSSIGSEKLSFKENNDSWSLLQVAEHLMLAQREVLEQIPDPSVLTKKSQNFLNKLKHKIVLLVLKFNIKVKVPSSGMIPNNNLNLNQIRCDWDKSQTWLELFIEYLKEEKIDPKTPFFSHPISGSLNIIQVLKLAHEHFDSHMRKIKNKLAIN